MCSRGARMLKILKEMQEEDNETPPEPCAKMKVIPSSTRNGNEINGISEGEESSEELETNTDREPRENAPFPLTEYRTTTSNISSTDCTGDNISMDKTYTVLEAVQLFDTKLPDQGDEEVSELLEIDDETRPEHIANKENDLQFQATMNTMSDDSVDDRSYEAGPSIRHHVVAESEIMDEDDTEDSRTFQVKGRPRKGRKRRFKDQSREEGKKRRNSNRSYFDYKGRKKESRVFNELFDCECILKCVEIVLVDERKQEFERFWSLDGYNSQNNYIAAAVTEIPKMRSYGRNTEKRQYSRKYRIVKKIVCREMFVKTLAISPCRVNTALKKFHGRTFLLDQRGIKQGGKNKTPEHKVQEVIDQINKIPKYISHYSRNKTEAKFLPPDVTLSKMYEIYSEEYENPLSLSKYKQIFYSNFNLRTKTLKKDTCNLCDGLKMRIDNKKDNDKKQELKDKHRRHIEESENAQSLRRDDFKKARENKAYECLTFDLEKTLPLPRVPTNIVFYKRQLWVYNSGVHGGSENRGYCYTWAEGTAGRGSQEVGSCLLKHIRTKMRPDVKHLILWSDSCGGQNRNIKMTLMLKHILHSDLTNNLESITLKFLCSGHSFLPNDSDFSDIESALKHHQRLYLPSDYVNIMKTCRKKNPLVVTEMSSNDFFGVSKIEKNITNRKVSVNGEKINWLNIRSISMKVDKPLLLYIQQVTFNDDIQEVDIKKLARGRPNQKNPSELFLDLVELWPNGKSVAEAKLENLREMYHLIPSNCLPFYEKLNGNAAIEEDIDGYNIETLDFAVENEDENY